MLKPLSLLYSEYNDDMNEMNEFEQNPIGPNSIRQLENVSA
jgi:hypothetical protein